MKAQKLLLALCILVFSFKEINSQEISSIGFENPICEGFDYSDLNVFSVRIKFEQIFQEYAPTITVYDLENENKIIELQAKNNSLGEMETAKAIASIFLINIGQYVTMQLKVVDVNANVILSSVDYTIPLSDIKDYRKLEIAIGNICVRVFEKLGISLSSTQVAVLKGEKNSSELSSLEMNEQVKNIDNQINILQEEMEKLKKKGFTSDYLQINKLQIAQDKLKIKREIENKRLQRRKDDEKRLQEEKDSIAKRSQEANERIKEQTKKYEQYATKVRKEQMRAIPSYQQIQEVEKIKQELLSMRIRKGEQIEKSKEKELAYAEQECQKIDAEPFTLIDKDANGNPLPERISERNEKKKKIREDANVKIEAIVLQEEKRQEIYEKKVLANINQNYTIMKKTKTVNSINDADVLHLRVGNYDGGKYGWIANVAFDLGFKNVVEYQILIPYKALFDEKPDSLSTKYKDNVEDYDSFFRNNIPVVYVSVDYSILPLEKDKPSQYLVKISETSIYKIDTDSNSPPKKIGTEKTFLQGYYVADVISDIRTYEEKRIAAEKLKKKEFKEFKSAEKEIRKKEREDKKMKERYSKNIEKEQRRGARKEATKEFFSPAWYLGINLGLQTSKFDIDTTRAFLTLDMPVYPLFLGMEITSGKSSSRQYLKGQPLSKTFEYLDSNVGLRLGYRMLGVKQGWFSPYFCINGGISFIDHNASLSEFSKLKENLTGYIAGTFGANFITSRGIFGLSYSSEYNVITKKLQHLLGLSVGVNIITEK